MMSMRRTGLGGTVLLFLICLGVAAPAAEQQALDQSFRSIDATRQWLEQRGVIYGIAYTNDLLGNLSGGNRTGFIDQGKLEGSIRLDLEKLLGLENWTFYSNGFVTHNTGRMRRDYVGGINTIAAIEAAPSVRLSELWLERSFFNGAASVRFGQLTADSEFFFSELSDMFMQSDWATITALNLPSGGPAYPLSTPGARLKVDPVKEVSLLLAVFNGDPAGPGPGDPDTRNRNGLNFRLSDPPLIIGEAQIRLNHEKNAAGLATTLKIGGWAHLGKFDDQRFASGGMLLANPASNGIPAMHRGDSGLYGVIDQKIYRPPNGGPDSGISIFSRGSISPSDRNPIDFYIDGGIVFAGMVPNRPNDRFGASVIYSRFSNGARAFDQDQINFGVPGYVRDYEMNIELTYVAAMTWYWTLQPDFQYIRHPNGQAGRDAKVVGLRSVWKF